jgi:hypothetical protein
MDFNELYEKKMEELKGWNKDSADDMAKSLGHKSADSKGFHGKCVDKMSPKVDNAEGFCAKVKDISHGKTSWRGKDKK